MPHSTEILPFAIGDGANVRTPSDWSGDTRRQTGFQIGVADPTAINTAIRQAAFSAAMVAEFTATYGPGDVLDNGNVDAFMAQFSAALAAAAAAPPASMVLEGLDSGSANAVSVSTLTPDNIVPNGGQLVIVTKNGVTNNGAMTATIKGLSGPLQWGDGTAISSGEFAANEAALMRWNGAQWRLLSFVGHPATPETIIQQITEGQSLASGEGIVVTNDQKIALDLASLSADGLANEDIFLFYKIGASHHRKITYATMLAGITAYVLTQIPATPPPTSYTQYPAVGVGVGQIILQQIQGAGGDNAPPGPGGNWGWTLGMTVSGSTLQAGTVQVSGKGLIFQNAINNTTVPANAGYGGVASGAGYWTAYNGSLTGTWQLDGWVGPTNFALYWGYAFTAIWRRIA
jgi:hypothetical protein